MTVPIIEVAARSIRVTIASFREQKKSHSWSVKLCSRLKLFSPEKEGEEPFFPNPQKLRLSYQKT
jgi:hypothetical protein